MRPLNPIVEAMVCRLNEDDREAFEERAAVMQFEAGHERELAEALALLDVLRAKPLAAVGVTVMQGRMPRGLATVLCLEPARGREHMLAMGAHDPRPADLGACLTALGGVALLTPLTPRQEN